MGKHVFQAGMDSGVIGMFLWSEIIRLYGKSFRWLKLMTSLDILPMLIWVFFLSGCADAHFFEHFSPLPGKVKKTRINSLNFSRFLIGLSNFLICYLNMKDFSNIKNFIYTSKRSLCVLLTALLIKWCWLGGMLAMYEWKSLIWVLFGPSYKRSHTLNYFIFSVVGDQYCLDMVSLCLCID